MNESMNEAFQIVLRNWKAMSGSGSHEAEATADQFEHSFYAFIDVVRDWFYGLETQPETLEEACELPEVKSIMEQLPGPLQLNFETELELIVEHKSRVDDDKYD